MLRVIAIQTVDILTIKLEGRLTGERAEQVRTLVTRSNTEMRLVVDITELMFVDGLGGRSAVTFEAVWSTIFSRNGILAGCVRAPPFAAGAQAGLGHSFDWP
jgi:anti-anti-sigma regulatory factor